MSDPVIAVDFDGTLVENKFPEIGKVNRELIKTLLRLKKTRNAKIVLWTCREGSFLDKAVETCKAEGLKFDAINENAVETKGFAEHKILAAAYIDDRAISPDDFIKEHREDSDEQKKEMENLIFRNK